MLLDENGQPLEDTSRRERARRRLAGAWKRIVVFAGAIAVIAALLTNMNSIAGLFGVEREPRKPPVPPNAAPTVVATPTPVRVSAAASALTPEYMRLFGAVEVPGLMELFRPNLRLRRSTELSPDGRPAYEDTASMLAINQDLYEFWRGFKYPKARPTAGGLWTTFVNDSNIDVGLNAYYSALSPTKDDAISFALLPDAVGEGNLTEETAAALHLTMKKAWEDEVPGTADEDIGYLFLVLQNTSGEILRDVDMTWIEYTNPLRRRDFGAGGDSVLGTLSWPEPRVRALTDARIDSMAGKRSTRSIASIAPGDSFIWLLAVYRAKRNGLPEFYITNVYTPVETTYTVGGSRVTAAVRAPYLERAERVLVPYGWVGQ